MTIKTQAVLVLVCVLLVLTCCRRRQQPPTPSVTEQPSAETSVRAPEDNKEKPAASVVSLK